MKRFVTTVVLLALVISLFAVLPVATAETTTDTIYFNEPTAIATYSGHIFVADKVEDNKSVIIYFDTNGFAYGGTLILDELVTGLSVIDDSLYVMMPNKTCVYTFTDGALAIDSAKTRSNSAIDYAKHGDTLYWATDDDICKQAGSLEISVAKMKSIEIMGDTLYYAYGTKFKAYDLANSATTPQNTLFNNATKESSKSTLVGLFTYGQNVAVSDANSIAYYELVSENYVKRTVLANTDYTISAVTCDGTNVYVLTTDREIHVLNFDCTTEIKTIGSDTVEQNIPDSTHFTSFTLATSSGYPTNVTYKTSDSATSISALKKNAPTEQFIIIGYEGAENSSYYYVYIDGAYGWIKKSDGATTPESDGKISVINTAVSGDATYVTKFNTLSTVNTYNLPSASAPSIKTSVSQSPSAMKEVTVLQKFTEQTENGALTWYYVEFDGTRAFVNATSVSGFRVKEYSKPLKAVGMRQIDASLWEAVKMYATADMSENEIVLDENGNVIKIVSGTDVNVVRYSDDEKTAFIELAGGDGNFYYGYVPAKNVISPTALTTNQIVGLVVMFVAVGAVVAVALVIVKRKQKMKS